MLFAFIVFTPVLINGPAHITEKLVIREETIEGSMLCVLFLLSILILSLYKSEVYRNEEQIRKANEDKMAITDRLHAYDQYFGKLNVEIREIDTIFNSISKYPETKAELKETYRFFGKRILGIVNSNWVLIRIINSNSQRTKGEHFETRQGYSGDYPHVSNKMIIENKVVPAYSSVISNPENFNILVFCIMPVEKISKDQHIFIQAILNEITKMFVILHSSFYKNKNIQLVDAYPYK